MSSASTRKNSPSKTRQIKVAKLLIVLSAAFLLILSSCNFHRENIAATAAYLYFQQTQLAESFATPPLELVQPIQTLLPTQAFQEDRPTPQPIETSLPVPPTPVTVCQMAVEPGKQLYCTQSGDRLVSISRRFRVNSSQIQGAEGLDPNAILPVNTPLGLPTPSFSSPYNRPALPDNAIIYGPDSSSSDIIAYAQNAGGFLKDYMEYLYDGWYSGPEIIELVAVETSTNPRLLLSLLEYQSNWLYGHPANAADDKSPLNYEAVGVEGLYEELQVAARELSRGFYGWREGTVQTLTFRDKLTANIAPQLNVGSVAVQYLFAGLYDAGNFYDRLYGSEGFLAFHSSMFGDPWARAVATGTLMPAGINQPTLSLPIPIGETWALTSGPHITWQYGTPRGGLDFAPLDDLPGCITSPNWAVASAPGLVVRSHRGAVAVDLDGDGNEGTGWVLLYMHLTPEGRAGVGTRLNQNDPVGHPSCEGGVSTGTHLHLTRKYNGEWIPAEGPLPFILDGWKAIAQPGNYAGLLEKDGHQVLVGPSSEEYTWITR
jgi:murein DD-endopeptidase MepM/ murein hydrolase activator NlpD